MTQYHVERLEKLRSDIIAEAELGKHDQRAWGKWWKTFTDKAQLFKRDDTTYTQVSCPSAACAAGWTIIGEGAKMLFAEGYNQADYCLTADGRFVLISAYAAELLGLDSCEQDRLFHADLTTQQVIDYLEQLIVAGKHDRTWAEQRRIMAVL